MKESIHGFAGLGGFKSTSKHFQIHLCLTLALLGLMGLRPAWGQAPNLVWKMDAYATLIGIDAQTNLYATLNSDGGSIVILNSAGVAQVTNKISPIGGLARRDGAGNYYFAGGITPPVDFGGGFVVTNVNSAVAKYDSTGHIKWAYGFGVNAGFHANLFNIADLEVDSNGVAYLTWAITFEESQLGELTLQTFSDTTNTIVGIPFPMGPEYLLLDAQITLTATNTGYVVSTADDDSATVVSLFSFSGGALTSVTNWNYPEYPRTAPNGMRSILDNAGNVYNTEYLALTKRTPSGDLIWKVSTSTPFLRCLAGDGYGGVQVADKSGFLARYDSDGNLIWTTNFPYPITTMITDARGNRFISRSDGVMARLQPEAMPITVITNQPEGGTVFAGDNFSFSVGATGFTPFNYIWLYQSNAQATATVVAGASNATLALTGVTANQAGLYSVIVSNVVNSVTSSSVSLMVKSVELYSGATMLNGGSYTFPSPPTLTIRSAFTNGAVFYTLDGSTPSFSSIPYNGAFVVSNSETIKAIGYSADFAQAALADPVIATVPPQFTLTISTLGGGVINGQQIGAPAGTFTTVITNSTFLYASNQVVAFSETPAPGFSFLGWQGSVTSTNTIIAIRMDQNQNVTAVFGTTLSTTETGNGRVLLAPPGGLYPYGTTVRVEALPQPGNVFGAWGNAASGSTSPLYFTVTNATPTISSIFGATPVNQSALTVLILGRGKVAVNPPGNSFATTASVSLTATPDAGQTFVDWSGSVSSTQNPLTVAMAQSRVIVAAFSGQSAALATGGSAANGLTQQGFQFVVTGDPQAVYLIQTSTNLTSWQDAGLLTNDTGEVQFMDPGATNKPATYYRLKLVTP